VGNRTKSVKDYAFSPEKLQTLELEIDRATNTHRWIHGSDDLKDWHQVESDIYRRTKPGMTEFMQAAGKGDAKALAKEHEEGSDINAQDETGWTAIMLAAVQCQLTTVQQLLDWHARTNIKDKNGDDALMGAASAFCYQASGREAQAQIIKLLIANGADPNLHDDNGLTPLMALTTYGNMEAARVLLDAGAQANAKDNEGMTALDHAWNALKKYYDNFWTEELQQLVKMLE
jgi:ankyrin repeat protein